MFQRVTDISFEQWETGLGSHCRGSLAQMCTPVRLSCAAVLPVILAHGRVLFKGRSTSCYGQLRLARKGGGGGAGKNRPLDEDELEFLDALQQQQTSVEQAWASEQERELDAFQQACRSARSCVMEQGPVCCATQFPRAIPLAASEQHRFTQDILSAAYAH